MKEKPKRRDEYILNKEMWNSIIVNGLFTTVVGIVFLKSDFIRGMFRPDENSIYLLTGFFGFFVIAAVANGFSTRTDKVNIFENIGKNKNFLMVMGGVIAVQITMTFIGGQVLRLAPLNFEEWLFVFALSMVVIPLNMLRKMIFKLKEANT
jgi:magnesium-transporting ATPase (P-type)